ncbi:MAG TPA: hypothetical protein VKB66_00525 [Candidatus Acidoferrum sp.]|nr:hypothetical protein [Candidatus Acidoferrum sp.]
MAIIMGIAVAIIMIGGGGRIRIGWTQTSLRPKTFALAYYSEAIYFIVTPRPYATTPIRAFSIRDGRAMELEIQLLP